MKRRHWLGLGILMSAGILLAPYARLIAQYLIIDPIAYYRWSITQVLQVFPQSAYWIGISVSLSLVVALILLRDLIAGLTAKEAAPHQKGAVEQLAEQIQKSQTSNYFKWVIANQLAETALKILPAKFGRSQQDRRNFDHLDWHPPPQVRKYFITGLNSSFMDYRKKKRFQKTPNATPFDIDLNDVIGYLESELE